VQPALTGIIFLNEYVSISQKKRRMSMTIHIIRWNLTFMKSETSPLQSHEYAYNELKHHVPAHLRLPLHTRHKTSPKHSACKVTTFTRFFMNVRSLVGARYNDFATKILVGKTEYQEMKRKTISLGFLFPIL
jgi:hypothetical protein